MYKTAKQIYFSDIEPCVIHHLWQTLKYIYTPYMKINTSWVPCRIRYYIIR